uniref:CSC1/OSCA1-like N-terminal transmembrane domain-containing protein n=1 Tax=Mucochytrium quahogii TaxID=96639 RepID=A0A7S2WDU2_9STRA|mmetsp:Transcript_20437/g.44405  ORF Transcript_20437/g.44405 Transcript_20437/m.44405 type:complete len:769 (+) Transcript_20437:596-2902(+)
MDSVAYPGEGTSYGNVRFLETVPSRSGLVKKDSSALVGNAESTKGQVDSDHVLVKTKTIGLAKKKDSDSKSVSADHVLVKSETIGGGDKNKSISQVVGATKNVVGDNNVVVETNTTNGKKLNGATNIGEGIVLVTNHSGGTILAIDSTDSKLPVARSYSPPQGWDSIADVCLFGSVIFVPVMLFFLFRYLKRSVDKGQGSKTQACTGVVSAFFRSAFLNTVRLRHCRGEDLENLGSEGALYLAIHRETMVLVFIMAVLGCSVLFPLHLSAGNEAVKLEFTRSTIQHLNKHSSLLWVHLVFIFLFSLLYYRYVWKCRQHVQWAWKHGVIGARSVDMWDASVFVKSNMSQSMSEDAVKAILEAVYPGQVSNVVIIVDNSQALLLENKLQQAEQDLGALKKLAQSVQRQDSQYAEESSGESVGREGLDGTTREWTLVLEKEEEIEEYREQQRKMGENRSAGKCIVTFDSVELAARFGDPAERKKAIRLAIHNKLKAAESLTTCPPEETTEENKLLQSYEAAERAAAAAVLKEKIEAAQLRDWDVVPSPDPHDIIWGALHLDPKVYWCRAIIANIIIAIFLALVTTPASLLGLISHVTKKQSRWGGFSTVLSEFCGENTSESSNGCWVLVRVFTAIVYCNREQCAGIRHIYRSKILGAPPHVLFTGNLDLSKNILVPAIQYAVGTSTCIYITRRLCGGHYWQRGESVCTFRTGVCGNVWCIHSDVYYYSNFGGKLFPTDEPSRQDLALCSRECPLSPMGVTGRTAKSVGAKV